MTTIPKNVLTDARTIRPLGRGDGVFYLGRPAWLTTDLHEALQRESIEQRGGAEHIRAQHFGEAGPVVRALRDSPELTDFVTRYAAPARPSGSANFRYYDIPDSHMAPHRDTDDYAVHLTVMLSHEAVTEKRSALLLFPHGPQPLAVCMEPGEVILFHAREVIHARTPISAHGDERAVNLGIGFTPIEDLGNPGYWQPAAGWSSEPA